VTSIPPWVGKVALPAHLRDGDVSIPIGDRSFRGVRFVLDIGEAIGGRDDERCILTVGARPIPASNDCRSHPSKRRGIENMDLGLQGKVVLIVGASRGIGAATARAFAREGASLCLVSRSPEDLERLVTQLRSGHSAIEILSFTRDATQANVAESVIQDVGRALGPVDVVVNNAGAGRRQAFEDLSEADWASSLSLNLMTAVRFSRAVLPDMKARRQGRIINLGAVSATRPRQGQIASNVAKAGLINFTRSLAMEMAPHNILVNAVCPGSVEGSRPRHESIVRIIPLGRIGTAEEVAHLIVFLAGEQASYITGAVMNVDGGMEAGIMLE
jgi:3-oxoacyl-[acyl-carrier protein] reductase